MENLPINILDIGVIVLLVLGAIIGLALGFVRGGLFVLSWLGSAIVTIFAFPVIRPYARQYIENEFSWNIYYFILKLKTWKKEMKYAQRHAVTLVEAND